ncbi:MAG TPA: PAS domain-containing protein [Planctomycetota bacterium]|nr:PAS domain-containing protein [Planctomycetota bacterium]
MDEDQEETPIRQLLGENQRLKQKLFEAEEKIRKTSGTATSTSSGNTSVLKLIEHKDFQIQQYTARLEEKKEQLEEATQELERKKAELSLWMSALRLCQELLANDASALVGVSRDGKVLLFNHTAPQVLGEKFKEALHKPIESVDFKAFDPETPRRVREAMTSGKQAESTVVVRDRKIITSVHPLGTAGDSQGVLIRIQSKSAK